MSHMHNKPHSFITTIQSLCCVHPINPPPLADVPRLRSSVISLRTSSSLQTFYDSTGGSAQPLWVWPWGDDALQWVSPTTVTTITAKAPPAIEGIKLAINFFSQCLNKEVRSKNIITPWHLDLARSVTERLHEFVLVANWKDKKQ